MLATATPHAQATRRLLPGLKILVVDDDQDTVTLMSTLLRAAGALPIAAHDVETAMTLFGVHRPDLILSDISMPGSDGYHLIRRVRAAAHGRTTPAIALTANAAKTDQSRVLLAGYQAYVSKPFKLHDLVGAILRVAT